VITGAVALGCGATSSGGTEGTEGSGGAGAGAGGGGGGGGDGKPAAKVGEAVRDGKFEFTVKSVKCGVAKVGPKLLEEKGRASSASSR
jgi:hypothetical protein